MKHHPQRLVDMTDKDKRYSELLDKQIAQLKQESRSLEFKSNHIDHERLGKLYQHYPMALVLMGRTMVICTSVLKTELLK